MAATGSGSLVVRSNGVIHAQPGTPRAGRYQVARFCEWLGEKDGVYRYRPHDHALTQTGHGDRRRELARATFNQSWIQDAAGLLIFSAVPDRTTRKYGTRGIRYVHMEAGHAAQNVYLQAVSLGLATAVVGAFEDDDVKSVIGIEEDALYVMPFVRPAE